MLAALNPDKLYAFFNTPGYGGADEMPKAVRKELAKGNWLPLAELVARALMKIADGRGIIVAGHSKGASLAAATAAHLEKVQSLALVDPLGHTKKSWPALMKQWYKEEQHAVRYKDADFIEKDRLLQPAEELTEAKVNMLYDMRGKIAELRALKEETLYNLLTAAAPQVTQKIGVVTPELSAYGDTEKVSQILRDIAVLDAMTARVEQISVRDQSHRSMDVTSVLSTYYDLAS